MNRPIPNGIKNIYSSTEVAIKECNLYKSVPLPVLDVLRMIGAGILIGKSLFSYILILNTYVAIVLYPFVKL